MTTSSVGPPGTGPVPIGDDRAIIVTGSLSTKPQDRTMTRADIVPMQVATSDGTFPVPFFRHRGEHGVASAVLAGTRIFFSLGSDLGELDLEGRTVIRHDVPALRDVHEMTMYNGDVLIANTGLDEVVVFSPDVGEVRERIPASRFRAAIAGDAPGSATNATHHEAVDRFHLNQVFVGENGDTWALVHHVNGKQLIKRVAEKVIKSHGNGGVVNLTTGVAVALHLQAPHSVRRVDDEYWVLDSGRGEARAYSLAWEQLDCVPTVGWGRGADVDTARGHLYAGMSPIRKRYLPFLADRSCFECCVEVLDTRTRSSLGVTVIPNIEQINNVVLIDRTSAELLLAFPVEPRTAGSSA